ncbi:MAG: hypothetical protein RL417_1529 [Pseudomonadota bacterium]|jgi:hypothetical protein
MDVQGCGELYAAIDREIDVILAGFREEDAATSFFEWVAATIDFHRTHYSSGVTRPDPMAAIPLLSGRELYGLLGSLRDRYAAMEAATAGDGEDRAGDYLKSFERDIREILAELPNYLTDSAQHDSFRGRAPSIDHTQKGDSSHKSIGASPLASDSTLVSRGGQCDGKGHGRGW